MSDKIIVFVALLFGITLLSVVADKIKLSHPIMLVLAGLLIWLIPGMPVIKLDPDVVFLIFLPPLLYAAAWSTSWNDFWAYKRPIGLLAFGLVVATSTIVAYFSVWLIPGFTLALGFLLGGIVSPPDAVAANSVLKSMKIPRRVSILLEGESLVNDASSLIIFRFAIAAVITGQFSLIAATGQFFIVAIMGVVVGLIIGQVVYGIHRFLPTTPNVDTALTLIAPYLAYLIAEHFHFSGVLSVVAAGLFLSIRAARIFSYEARLQAIGVWSTLVFILNSVVFVLIGLQLPQIIGDLDGATLLQAVQFGTALSVLIIIVRMAWVFPGAYLPLILFRSIRKREPWPNWKGVFIVGWSGMRGVVSLASALAVPLIMQDGSAFPFRNLLLFITFFVILVTLVVQGLSLPWIISLLKIPVTEDDSAEEKKLRIQLAYSSIEKIEASYSSKDATRDALHHIKTKYERRIDHINQRMLTADSSGHSTEVFHEFNKLQVELVNYERAQLTSLRHNKKFSEEVLRKLEYELDLEEAVLRRQAQVKIEEPTQGDSKKELPVFKL
ncbi:MAG: Na+/H+ antiporter [Chitinophagales bacterium]